MTNIETVHSGKFVEMRIKEHKGSRYEYLHEHRCDGQIVSVLVLNEDITQMLVRREETPCWGDDGNFMNSITGGWEADKHDTPVDTVVAEMREEAGIVIEDRSIIKSLGTCRGAKSVDSTYHLYVVLLEEGKYTETEPEPDSNLEQFETVEWIDIASDWLQNADDPMLYVLSLRYAASMP